MFQLQNNRRKSRGFALIIALVLMSFVLLLIISLSTLLKIESHSGSIRINEASAKQNALLGMQIALGRLQSDLGPDRRATVRSGILDVTPQSPYMVGVYKTANDEQANSNNPADYLQSLRDWSQTSANIDWLVSSVASMSDPATQSIESLNNEVVIMQTLMDEVNSIETTTTVKAGQIPIDSDAGVTGTYAWWIDDESQKAKINIIAPEALNDGTAFEDNWKMTPAQQTVLRVDNLTGYDPGDSSTISNLLGLEHADLNYTVTNEEDWFRKNALHFTTHSRGLPVDVTQGRLKQDLSVYLKTGPIDSFVEDHIDDSTPIIRGYSSDDNYKGPQFSDLDYSDNDMPRFGLIRSWKEIGESVTNFSNGGIESQPQTNEQHGIHPVILRAGMYYAPFFTAPSTGTSNEVTVWLAVYPRVTIWNPTTVPITDEWYLFQVGMTNEVQLFSGVSQRREFGAIKSDDNVIYGEPITGGVESYYMNVLNANREHHRIQTENEAIMPVRTFALKLDSPLLPGQTRTFYPETSAQMHKIVYDVTESGSPKLADITTNNINSDVSVMSEDLTNNYFVDLEPKTLQTSDGAAVSIPNSFQTYIRIRYAPNGVGFDGVRTSGCAYRLLKVNDTEEPTLLTEFFSAEEASGTSGPIAPYSVGVSENYADPYDGVSANGASLITFSRDPNLNTKARRGHQVFLTYAQEDPESDFDSVFKDSSKQFSMFSHYNPRSRHVFPGTYETNVLGKIENSRFFDSDVYGIRQELYSEGRPESDWLNDRWPNEDYQSLESGYGDGDDSGSPGLLDIETSSQGLVYKFFDYPRKQDGVLSIGDLQSVNFATYAWQPGNAFGNSRADPRISRDSIFTSFNDSDDASYIRTLNLGSNRYIDLSWLLNHSLWDRFFASTIPYDDGNFSLQPGERLRNARHLIVNDAASNTITGSNTGDAFNRAAEEIMVDGAFNVNTTSVMAWKHFLAANFNRSLDVVNTDNGTRSHPNDQAAFPRALYPYRGEPATNDLDVDNRIGAAAAFSANRSLTDNELQALAEKIVEEVKARGPFLSVADFVNRRLVSATNNTYGEWAGLSGVLQTAIDRVTVEDGLINNHLYADTDLIFESGDVPSYLEEEHVVGLPDGNKQTRLAGAPGSLTQADILRSLGAYLTVRGDTFRIRAYGEARNPITEEAIGKVWCEAVVQRIASTVDSNDDVVSPNEGNYPLGRQFKIIAFRWLDADDV